MAVPHAAMALVAVVPWFGRLERVTGLPVAMIAAVAVQTLGVGLAREFDLPLWRRVWVINLLICTVLFPLLTLQTTSSRVSPTSREWGGLSPMWWASIGVLIAIVAIMFLVGVLSTDDPEDASVFFVPVALIVPAVLGAPGDLGEQDALSTLAEVYLVSLVACAVGWMIPRGPRVLVGPVALATQFVVLWILGYGASFPSGRDPLVGWISSAILVVTTLSTVFVPLLSLWFRRIWRLASRPGWG